ncbi:PAS domain-containing protein [Namhaeicola litoreus]|uniref:PAS domain-containing protein n=1 Tax=Namhaeicola litoreus TaxID=1052145 RepID=A0ABW3Y2V2_9FLAO
MPSKEIEIILSRQLADCLSVPIFIVDTSGNLIFYNEPAEELLGLKFDETGGMPVSEWSTIFKPQDDHGKFLPPQDLPLVETLSRQLPAHGAFWINKLNGPMYKISVTSFPIMGRPNRFLGAMAIFWKTLEK